MFVTGGGGQLGGALRQFLNEAAVFSYHNHSAKEEHDVQLDITDASRTDAVLSKYAPDIIIHAAALTDVDACERNLSLARAVNVDGTRNIARYAGEHGCKLVYVSTDYVFDGKKGMYTEADAPHPVNVYGSTKLEGERVAVELCDDAVIARTSVLYGAEHNNFFTWVKESLSRGEAIQVVDDQYVSPTWTHDLCEQLLALIDHDARGVFHAAGGTRCSRYDFALILADIFGYDVGYVEQASMADMNWLASRPRDSSLDVSKLSDMKQPYSLRDSLEMIKEEKG